MISCMKNIGKCNINFNLFFFLYLLMKTYSYMITVCQIDITHILLETCLHQIYDNMVIYVNYYRKIPCVLLNTETSNFIASIRTITF